MYEINSFLLNIIIELKTFIFNIFIIFKLIFEILKINN